MLLTSFLGIGYSLVEVDIENKHNHPFGGVHGGLYCSEVIMGFSTVDELQDQDPDQIITVSLDKDQDVPNFEPPEPDPEPTPPKSSKPPAEKPAPEQQTAPQEAPEPEKAPEPVNGEIVDNDPLGLAPHPNQASFDRLVERISAFGADDEQIRIWTRMAGIDVDSPETMINSRLDKLWSLAVEAKQTREQAEAQKQEAPPEPSQQPGPPIATGSGWSMPELLADMSDLAVPTSMQNGWMTEAGIVQFDRRTHSQPRLEKLAVLIKDYRQNA